MIFAPARTLLQQRIVLVLFLLHPVLSSHCCLAQTHYVENITAYMLSTLLRSPAVGVYLAMQFEIVTHSDFRSIFKPFCIKPHLFVNKLNADVVSFFSATPQTFYDKITFFGLYRHYFSKNASPFIKTAIFKF